ncbi:hypothetical protein PCANC_05598 [Puccinia coronata f. sp. avenae]|uniref:Reverse transcriptase Ty1/copia-type domain-containing protein n=1 Tax=Puccinia coronata f. sp. avenae TaxID=200324 RepID=A0A2N5VWV7_9BASI|nr:hypothetical protein PCANC_05598 [Puccinia coronata f. sp. avenae]
MAAPMAIVNPMAALMAIVNPMAALRASDGHHQPNGPSDGHCNYPMVVRADACSEQPFSCSTPQWPPAQWPLTTQWLPPRRLRHSMAALSGHWGNQGMDLSNQYSISDNASTPAVQSAPPTPVRTPQPPPAVPTPSPPPPRFRSSLAIQYAALVPPQGEKRFAYVPASQPPSKEIIGGIDACNVVSGSCQSCPGATSSTRAVPSAVPPAVTDLPGQLLLVQFDEPKYLFLTQTFMLKEAFNNLVEVDGWHDAMLAEYTSLSSKNTGTLVPPPGDDKAIRGMWLLSCKLNEFGNVLQFKAWWVCFGNHQVHMRHYFNTYASVARNELFKLLLTIAVNRAWHVFQFDVETAFLYGEIDAPVP